ncbi:TPA: hypothetical protein QEM47_000942 [Pseudomonas putida]|uniref:hypothetical protein n=1 Tax=Pseudomonas putida TaxID=303 RepID=UPI002061C32F|nr:hypothetical protein [Pseudomonas putida]MDD2116705.1 hypothetical protein [Pseudomonas putida]UPU94027.1 hypothetical protein M0766_06480 [Pseudomonas putida]HDS1728219.1 hypothetical protein [Pseudomonas putida]
MSQVKERPILFSGPMVRAILEGRKTVTRRPIKPSMRGFDISFELHQQEDGSWRPMHTFDESSMDDQGTEHPIACPYGQIGDRLWVREAWAQINVAQAPGESWVVYRECDNRTDYGGPWKPSIHMRRRDSRILLEITDVRVERLQDGEGETDFESRYVAEGINRIHHGDGEHYYHPFKSEPGPRNWVDPFDAWRELWASINGADSWNANPWVWVVEFKQVAA